MTYIRPLEIILVKKTAELDLLFHKKDNLASFQSVKINLFYLSQYREKDCHGTDHRQKIYNENQPKLLNLWLLAPYCLSMLFLVMNDLYL